jgi:hypothetical protein
MVGSGVLRLKNCIEANCKEKQERLHVDILILKGFAEGIAIHKPGLK